MSSSDDISQQRETSISTRVNSNQNDDRSLPKLAQTMSSATHFASENRSADEGRGSNSPRVVQRLLEARRLAESYNGSHLRSRPSGDTNKPRTGDTIAGKEDATQPDSNGRDPAANNAAGAGGRIGICKDQKHDLPWDRFEPGRSSQILASFNERFHSALHAGKGIDIEGKVAPREIETEVREYAQIVYDYAEEMHGYNDREYYANFQLGYIHEIRANFLLAERQFRKAVRTDNVDCWVDAVFHLATCLQRQGKVWKRAANRVCSWLVIAVVVIVVVPLIIATPS